MLLTIASMIFLFRSGTLKEKLTLIFKATRTHAQNLARFATIYKLTCLALKYLGSEPGKEGITSFQCLKYHAKANLVL